MILRSALAAAATVLLLSGCVSASSGSGQPTSEPGPTASNSSTPIVQGDPQSTLPLACTDVFSDSAASGLIFSPVSVRIDQLTVRTLSEAAGLQVGLFHCIWGGKNKTDNGWDQTIELSILPNADAAFDAGVWQVNDGAIVYPKGSTTSEYLCPSVGSNYAQCSANVLENGYWAHAFVSTGGAAETLSQAGIEASMRTIVDRLTAVIASAETPRSPWLVPTHTLAGAICGGQPLSAAYSAPFSAEMVAVQRSGAVACEYSPSVNIRVLPGGAWAVASIQSNGTTPNYSVSSFTPTAVAGADLALSGCGDGCYALLSVGGSAVSITDAGLYSGNSGGEADFLAELPQIVAAITAAG